METLGNQQLQYTGKVQPQDGEKDAYGQRLYPYFPHDNLVEVVNLAIFLERPLLLKGEPGCGKTRLAAAVAYELGLPLEIWPVKSTSRARDGLYTYDTVARLRDAQLAASSRIFQEEEIKRISNPATYVRWGALGKAFLSQQRTVVLIDEIDKADIDFPNDLLMELDQGWFKVEEIGKTVRAKTVPIVLITSNDEKELSDAFLRRCLFYYLEFPSDDQLREIIKAHFPQSSQELVAKAVTRFKQLRQEMEKQQVGKKVSTSELMDWFKVLSRYPQDEILAKLEGKLPYPWVLLKSWEHHRRYLNRGDDY
ncbi:MAG: MoxR family ATPase [Symploca sp. SIO2D2]|nr:MoxR family ATPase [Symploca sp. SIO2D2]